MYCQNKIVYTIQDGDSLYRLAKHFHTTVTDLILGNPGVNPYNLQLGMQLNICPGEDYDGPEMRPENQRPGMGNQMPGMIPGQGNPMPGMMPGQGNPMPGMIPGQGNPMPGMMPGQGNPMPGMMPGQGNSMPEEEEETESEMENNVERLMEAMRLAWLDMLFWNRMYLMTVDADSKDQQAVEERALETADEITDVFASFLPINVVRQLRNLLTEHVELTGEIARTLKAGDTENYDNLIKQWYNNANQLANLLGNQNPYFGGRETRNLLLNYLDMTREAMELQFNGEYGQSIDVFRDIQKQVLEMADYFARGLLAR